MLGYLLGITLVLTVLSPLIFTDVFADTFTVNFDKQSYGLGDSLTVSGNIIEIGMPVIAMSVYDPDGKILSANNLEISSEKTFSKIISLDSPFYEKSGKYLVKFNYGQVSQNHYFVIENETAESEALIDTPDEPEIILLYTEQKYYADNDVIRISGLVSALDSPTVLIGIYDPFGMPTGFYFASIDSALEFSTSFLVKAGVNFKVDGTYSIKAHYAETEATSFFEYSKIPPTTNDNTIQNPVEETP
ncbi:MAG: tetratricopeptide repeat-containing protein, partial [Nitrosopumilales archaeon CG_4_9_14_0_2_um_filter_34_16]